MRGTCLRSIHHSNKLYDHGKTWLTHVSIQGDDFQKTPEWRETWRKPVIFDECKYEGNIPRRWGDISAQEMTRRFWLSIACGAYMGHGESAPLIAFLRRIIESGPADGLAPLPGAYYTCAAKPGEFYLHYRPISISPTVRASPPT